MRHIRLILIYLGAFISCSLLSSIGIQPVFIFILLTFYLFLFLIFPSIYTVFLTKNSSKVERFLQSNREKLLFHYTYALAHESKEKQQLLLKMIVEKEQHPNDHFYFKSSLALLSNDFDEAIEYAMQIPDEDLRHYTMAYVEINRGNTPRASILLQRLPFSWRRSTLEALLAFSEQKIDEFRENTTAALKNCRGIDRYTIDHLFNKCDVK